MSHWATEDIALVRALPNIIILSASDCLAAIKLVIAASLIKGPVYVRLSGGLNCPIVYEKDCSNSYLPKCHPYPECTSKRLRESHR